MPFSDVAALISASWLQDRVDNPEVVILDCRWRLTDPQYGARVYAEGHIPGARRVDLNTDLSSPPGDFGGRHPLPGPEAFTALMTRLGVGPDSYVVCYDDDAAGAARCWWLLQFYGHDKVSVLDGGYGAWVANGGQVSTAIPNPTAGRFQSHADPRMTADYQTIATLRDEWPLIDSRARERYSGAQEPIDRVGGHIPGAVNIPYSQALNADGTYRSATELREVFRSVAEKDPMVYCGSGVSACVNVLALRLLGSEPLLYPGSWSDWIQHTDAPIARGDS